MGFPKGPDPKERWGSERRKGISVHARVTGSRGRFSTLSWLLLNLKNRILGKSERNQEGRRKKRLSYAKAKGEGRLGIEASNGGAVSLFPSPLRGRELNTFSCSSGQSFSSKTKKREDGEQKALQIERETR